jgi:putative flavoprotein involved in K+ transport
MTTHHQAELKDPAGSRLMDVVVVGSSQAGLAMAWHLAQQGLRFVVLEAGPELGHTWRSRWDSLTLFTPAQDDALPGMAFPAPADTYPTKDPVADYLQAYATAHDLPVRLNAKVTETRQVGEGFEVHTADDEVFRARQVVVATGPFQIPFVPPPASKLDASVTQVHSADYRNPTALPEGPVLVVGGGDSGFQIAEELAATRQVDLSIATTYPMLPQRLAGRDLFWWLTRLGLMRVTVGSRLGRREFIIGTNRRTLERAGVRFRPRLMDAEGRTVRFADHSILEDVGVVVWATGYGSDHSWIHIPGVVREGHVVHRRGVTEVPALYFLGLSWQHTRGSALLGFVNDDAAYLADRIATRHQAAVSAKAGVTQQPSSWTRTAGQHRIRSRRRPSPRTEGQTDDGNPGAEDDRVRALPRNYAARHGRPAAGLLRAARVQRPVPAGGRGRAPRAHGHRHAPYGHRRQDLRRRA